MPDLDTDVVGITVGQQTLSGWRDVRITRGIERCPSDCELALTERFPGTPTQIVIKPGDPCQVTVGGQTVITGYVDRYTAAIGPETHDVHITVRGMCQDIVDCSAELQTFQVNNTTLVALAAKLCEPFGINVVALDGDSAVMPQFNVILTETPYEIIERVARWANFLAYEDTNGSLVIAKVGDDRMASGFAQGQNVQTASVSLSTDNRFTEYRPVYLSTAFLNETPKALGIGGSQIPDVPGAQAFDKSFPARADGQPRYRPLIIVSEQTANLPMLAMQRTQWDMARRIGRSQMVTLTCDSWRDNAGTLWTPNSLAVVDLPILKLEQKLWLISEVTFSRGESGTTADVTLMPKGAFVPEPDVLLPYDWQVGQATGGTANYGPAPR